MLRINILTFWLALALACTNSFVSRGHVKYLLKPDTDDLNDFRSEKYVIIQRNSNGKKDSAAVYVSKAANEGPQREWGAQKGKSFHFANLTIQPGQILDLEIYKLNSKASKVQVRPAAVGYRNVTAIVKSNTALVSLKIRQAAKISVEFSDDSLNVNPLVIFVNNPENKELVPDKTSPTVFVATDSASLRNIPPGKNVIYFDAKLYNIGYWPVPKSITQIYFANNAIVRGYIECNRNGNAPPITINGRGILSNKGWPYHYPSRNNIDPYENNSNWYKSIFVYGGSGHLIEGVTIIDPTAFVLLLNAGDSKVSNVKINGFRFNNDGITVMGENITVDNCFVRVNDDAIVPYVKNNLSVQNCVFWQLQAGSIFQFGWTPHTLKNITIKDCDVLHAEWLDRNENSGFINAMGMMKNTQKAEIENIFVSNIYFDTPVTRFLDLSSKRKSKRNEPNIGQGEPWVYNNCNFTNIHFNQNFQSDQNLIRLAGFSDDHPSTNFRFTNFYFNKQKISSDSINGLMNVKNFRDVRLK